MKVFIFVFSRKRNNKISFIHMCLFRVYPKLTYVTCCLFVFFSAVSVSIKYVVKYVFIKRGKPKEGIPMLRLHFEIRIKLTYKKMQANFILYYEKSKCFKD